MVFISTGVMANQQKYIYQCSYSELSYLCIQVNKNPTNCKKKQTSPEINELYMYVYGVIVFSNVALGFARKPLSRCRGDHPKPERLGM